ARRRRQARPLPRPRLGPGHDGRPRREEDAAVRHHVHPLPDLRAGGRGEGRGEPHRDPAGPAGAEDELTGPTAPLSAEDCPGLPVSAEASALAPGTPGAGGRSPGPPGRRSPPGARSPWQAGGSPISPGRLLRPPRPPPRTPLLGKVALATNRPRETMPAGGA